jgi:hypothetical protein
MIRLTVLYNLPHGADQATYVAWRLSAHAEYIRRMPGVLNEAAVHWDWTVLQPRIVLDGQVLTEKGRILCA